MTFPVVVFVQKAKASLSFRWPRLAHLTFGISYLITRFMGQFSLSRRFIR